MRLISTQFFCLFLTLGSLVHITPGNAQTSQKNEIGVYFLSFQTSPFYDRYGRIPVLSEDKKIFNLLNGLTYKRYFDKHIVRASFTARNITSIETRPENLQKNYKEGSYNEKILKIGYERNICMGRITPYLAVDVGLFHLTYSGRSRIIMGVSNYELSGYGIGVSPAFGMKLKLAENLSINVESCLDFAQIKYKHIESSYTYQNARFTTNIFHTTFNPLQKLSLNIKF